MDARRETLAPESLLRLDRGGTRALQSTRASQGRRRRGLPDRFVDPLVWAARHPNPIGVEPAWLGKTWPGGRAVTHQPRPTRCHRSRRNGSRAHILHDRADGGGRCAGRSPVASWKLPDPVASRAGVNALAPVIVHVHEGSSGLLVALVGVGGTIVGVLIGAGTASRRQVKQLAHDREVRELETLRQVLDEGAEALGTAKASQVRLVRLWRDWMPTKQPKLDEAANEQRAAIAHARSVSHRLDLRLPPSDPVLQRYKTAGKALDELAALTMNASGWNYANYREQLGEIDERLGTHTQAFLDEARARFGPRLPRGGAQT
jgi:hypothetical protein